MNDQEKHQARDAAAATLAEITVEALPLMKRLESIDKTLLPNDFDPAREAWGTAFLRLTVLAARARGPVREAAWKLGEELGHFHNEETETGTIVDYARAVEIVTLRNAMRDDERKCFHGGYAAVRKVRGPACCVRGGTDGN